jgi:Lon protease-like protein
MGTALDDLPPEFAVFPLSGALLLPGGKLPLNIFEKRYLRMIDDALSSGRVIGMIQPDESRADTPSGPALYRVGCVGRLTSFSETDDGRYLVTLTGVMRFGVQVELEMYRGYRLVRADLARFQLDLDDGAAGPIDRDGLLGALRAYFQAHGFDANWDAIDEMPDGPLVNTLAMVCPFEPPEKQALLEAMSDAERAQTLLTLLTMGAHSSDFGGGREGQPGRRAT